MKYTWGVLSSALDAFLRARVLVVGDVMLDHYAWGETTRISPEAPVPVVRVLEDKFYLGGAGNVAANVARLCASTTLVGVVGNDPEARKIFRLMGEAGVESYGVTKDEARKTTVKTRVFAGQHQVARVDREIDREIDPLIENRVVESMTMTGDYDAVIIQDYDKGTLTRKVVEAAFSVGRAVVDPKRKNFGAYRGATVFKPNAAELREGLGRDVDLTEESMEEARVELGAHNLVVTRGAEGIAVKPQGRPLYVRSTEAREVYDVSGAGDTVCAIFGLAVAAGVPMEEATELANLAAGVVVSKSGTATVSREELLEAARTAAEVSR